MVEPCYIQGVQKQQSSQMFYKVGVLENLAKFTGKHLESLFNKSASLRRLHQKCFSMIFAKLLRTPKISQCLI